MNTSLCTDLQEGGHQYRTGRKRGGTFKRSFTGGNRRGEETAKIYGLKILEESINESESNTTRFVVLSAGKDPEHDVQREMYRHKEAFTLILIVKNEAGAVARAITTIGDFGFNMRTLRSRPLKKLAWSYYFYIEGEGNLDTVTGINMLRELEKNCECVKVLGGIIRRM